MQIDVAVTKRELDIIIESLARQLYRMDEDGHHRDELKELQIRMCNAQETFYTK